MNQDILLSVLHSINLIYVLLVVWIIFPIAFNWNNRVRKKNLKTNSQTYYLLEALVTVPALLFLAISVFILNTLGVKRFNKSIYALTNRVYTPKKF